MWHSIEQIAKDNKVDVNKLKVFAVYYFQETISNIGLANNKFYIKNHTINQMIREYHKSLEEIPELVYTH